MKKNKHDIITEALEQHPGPWTFGAEGKLGDPTYRIKDANGKTIFSMKMGSRVFGNDFSLCSLMWREFVDAMNTVCRSVTTGVRLKGEGEPIPPEEMN